MGSVRSKRQCFLHCNSDNNCYGIGVEKKTNGDLVSCFQLSKFELEGSEGEQIVQDTDLYLKGE